MKKKLHIILACMLFAMVFSLSGVVIGVNAESLAVVDDADIFTTEQEASLTSKIEDIKNKYDFDVTLVTTTDTEGESLEDYARYHSSLDASRDGLIFAHDISEREYYTVSRGRSTTVISDAALDRIDDVVVPYFKEDEFFEAHSAYHDEITKFLLAAESGETYSGEPMGIMDYALPVGIGIVGGLLLALIITGAMKASMNTARKKEEASSYVRADSFNLHQSYDRFLYQHTSRTAKPKNDNNGGGSSRGGSGGGSY